MEKQSGSWNRRFQSDRDPKRWIVQSPTISHRSLGSTMSVCDFAIPISQKRRFLNGVGILSVSL